MKNDYLSLFPDSLDLLGIKELQMEFIDDRLEKKYKEDTRDNFFSAKRLGLIIGVVIFLLFSVVDFLLLPKLNGIVWFVRLGVIIPIFMITYALTNFEKFHSKLSKVFPFLTIFMGITHVICLNYMPFNAISAFHSSYVILIIYTFIFMRSGFISGVLNMGMMTFVYTIFVLFTGNLDSVDKIFGLILIISTASMGTMFIYRSEYSDRRNYLVKKNSSHLNLKKALVSGDDKGDKRFMDLAKINQKNESKIKDLIKKLSLIEEENKNLLNEKDILKDEKDILLDEKSILQKEIETLKEDKDSSKNNEISENVGSSNEEKNLETFELIHQIEQQKLENIKANTQNEQALSEISKLESEISKLISKNKIMHSDMDVLRTENTSLRDMRVELINENSLDNMKLMVRMASFVSSTMNKHFSENINYLNENENLFSPAPVKSYINLTKNRIFEGMYLSGAMIYRFDLFMHYLKDISKVEKAVDIGRVLESSISQLSKYFENTKHIVEISCKDNISVRMNEDSLKLIIQNLVIGGLLSAVQIAEDALIEIFVKEEKSRVSIEYKDNGKAFPSYYGEIVRLKNLDSNVLSVNGIELYLAKKLIRKECGGEVSFGQNKNVKRFKMTFTK